jgi:hypothetical protein
VWHLVHRAGFLPLTTEAGRKGVLGVERKELWGSFCNKGKIKMLSGKESKGNVLLARLALKNGSRRKNLRYWKEGGAAGRV